MLVLDDTIVNVALPIMQRSLHLATSHLNAIASMVTRNRLEGHALAVALTDGYVAGLLAGAVLFTVGAVVAICTVNARISPAEAAAR
jgi:hypothetical protein